MEMFYVVKHHLKWLIFGFMVALLAACDFNKSDDTDSSNSDSNTSSNGSNTGGSGGTSSGLDAPNPSLSIGLKQLTFTWPAVADADHYRILVNPDGASGFSVVAGAESISGISHTIDVAVHLTDWIAAQYMVEACDAAETACVGSTNQVLVPADSVTATGYFKASNAGDYDYFGFAMALSGDGSTLAVGAYSEDSDTTGVNSTPNDNVTDAGAVYVYVRDSVGDWKQQAYIKASNAEGGDLFGYSVAINDRGNTLIVGAPTEDSDTIGVNTTPNEDATLSGAAYVFVRDDVGSWKEQAYLKASNTGDTDYFGYSVAVSGDGDTVAVGAVLEDSSVAGINSTPDENTDAAGAAYVFVRDDVGSWKEQAYIKASNPGVSDSFGYSVALSEGGDTLAVGARDEASDTMGVNTTPNDNVTDAGAVYVFVRDSVGDWKQQAYIKASNTGSDDRFGYSVSLSGDGDTLAVGAYWEDSSVTGIDSTPDEGAEDSGAVYVLVRDELGDWKQQAYIKKGSNIYMYDYFGYSVSLSDDGSLLAVGALGDNSATGGISATPDGGAINSGAVHLFERDGFGNWRERAYVKASNPEYNDEFGIVAALSDDGTTLAVGAVYEDSATNGVNTIPDEGATDSGAVYLY